MRVANELQEKKSHISKHLMLILSLKFVLSYVFD